MFDAIAPRYDRLNRVLSAGIDRRWRRRAVEVALAGRAAASVADACCGTGDLAFALAGDGRVRRVLGFDFAPAMLKCAQAKRRAAGGPSFAVADALAMPVRSASFDVVTVAFGLRNLVDPAAGIAELARLLKPGGRLVVLEFFAAPQGIGAGLFRAYFRHVLPRIGRWFAGSAAIDAYRYLPASVESFASMDEVGGWFCAAGFERFTCERMLAGAVGLLSADRAAAAVSPRGLALAGCAA